MKISEVKTTAKNVSLEAIVKGKGDVRDVNTRFGATRVSECVIEDESGEIILVLWGDQIDFVKEGDRIRVENAYVKEWQGKLQLNVGRSGKIEVV